MNQTNYKYSCSCVVNMRALLKLNTCAFMSIYVYLLVFDLKLLFKFLF